MNWIRLGTIAALIVGSAYVLLPNFVGETAEDRLATQATSVSADGPEAASVLDVAFTAASGEAAALAEALQARLDAAAIDVDRVEGDADGVLVKLKTTGGSRAQVLGLAVPGRVTVHDPTVFGPIPTQAPEGGDAPPQAVIDALLTVSGIDVGIWSSVLGGIAGEPVEDTALSLSIGSVSRTDAGVQLVLEDPQPSGVTIVGVDGQAQAVRLPSGRVFSLNAGSDAVETVIETGPLPGVLTPVVAEVEAAPEATTAPEAAADDSVPPWLAGLLPDTRIPLGLDLQGGIDLTLQVQLEEAVLGRAARDTTYLRDAAAREGLIIESARRAPDDPIVEIVTDAELGDVTAFVAQRLEGFYQYFESEGQMHRFEMTEQRQEEVRNQSIEQVLETLRKRVDATGVKEPSIVKKGGGRINVQLPGMDDVEQATNAIGTTAVLDFRMVDHDHDDALLEQIIEAAEDTMPRDQFLDDDLLNRWLWDTKRLDPDRIVMWSEPGNEKMLSYSVMAWTREVTPEGVELQGAPRVLRNEVPLTGNDVNDAGVAFDATTNLPGVSLEFKPRGGNIFCDLTKEAVGKNFAIILDSYIMSSPRINEQICGGAARIDMSSAADPLGEAQTLALVLRTGALDAPVVLASVRQVGASLGADSIRQGQRGAIVGLVIILIFMGLWYRMAGLIADFALCVNVLMVLAALATFGATLTLPGIAGIALTIGMAVDANIIIYERIREELRLGVQPRKAVDVGFDKAMVAVLDANITTAIAGVVLFSYGTGPIKGFAVTLLIGIVTTLVTALFVTRTVMELVTRSSSARLRI